MKVLKILSLFGLMLLISLSFSPPAFAETKQIIAEGIYNMGDGETPTMAEDRALLAAKKIAIEQAGTYVESYSQTKNYKLTKDEVNIIASGIMEVSILDKQRSIVGTSFTFWVKIQAKVTTDNIELMAKKIQSKREVQEDENLAELPNELGISKKVRMLLFKKN